MNAMNRKFNLGLVIHCHQPVGNLHEVIENAYNHAYNPLIKTLARHPRIKVGLHFSGVLWEWFGLHKPEFLASIAELVSNGQVELLTGGFYEPVLAMIPDHDKLGQIRMLSEFLEHKFHVKPTGIWLTERVWEPQYPRVLNESGVHYTLIDDTVFKSSGLYDEDMFGYYITEDQSARVKVFSILKTLRYLIPFRAPEEALQYLREQADAHAGGIAVFGDDGEKFGVWPGTYALCHKERWLDKFFGLLEEAENWLQTCHLQDYTASHEPLGMVYLPTLSYEEMMEWSLPARAQREYSKLTKEIKNSEFPQCYTKFIRGGFWRNFLAKYPESNWMQKRMTDISDRYHSLVSQMKLVSPRVKSIQRYIWQAQCNCAYWHGVFGGLYLPHLREAIWKRLITAEKEIEMLVYTRSKLLFTQHRDIDRDESPEVCIGNSIYNIFFSPRNGGSIIELDYKPSGVNYSNVLTRREEAYHDRIPDSPEKSAQSTMHSIHEIQTSKEAGLKDYLNFDWYRRVSLLDHFLHPDTTIEQFWRCKYGEQGDFVNQPYEIKDILGKDAKVVLHRTGTVWIKDKPVSIKVSKQLGLGVAGTGISISYIITPADVRDVEVWFGCEFNLHFSSADTQQNFFFVPDVASENKVEQKLGDLRKIAEYGPVHAFGIRDGLRGLDLILTWDTPAKIWVFPIETVSSSEAGFERSYQGNCLLFHWKVNLAPHSLWEVKFNLSVRPTST